MIPPTSAYLGDHKAIVKIGGQHYSSVPFGRKIFVDTRDLAIAPHILLDGQWEPWITEVMVPMLKGCTFIDVGANIGWYSLLASHFGAKTVMALEPNPRMWKLASDTMRVNGFNWVLLHWAAGNSDEDGLELRVNNSWPGSASCTKSGGFDAEEVHTVKQCKLDSVLRNFDNESHVILKVDVEGWEPKVIEGAKQLLTQRTVTAFVEYHADPAGGLGLRGMLDFFEQNRYNLGLVTHERMIVPISRATLDSVPDAEMLCFRRFSD